MVVTVTRTKMISIGISYEDHTMAMLAFSFQLLWSMFENLISML